MASNAVVIDLSNYKDRFGQYIDPGRYRVVVEDAEMDTSKAGNPMVNLWLTVQGGDFDGATITDRLTITEKALFRVVAFMSAIGLPTPKKRLQVSLQQFIGKRLEIDVEDGDPYNGRVRSEVRGYMRIKAAAAEEVADVADLDADEEEPTPESEYVSDEPTDYDEDAEPEKAKAAAVKKARVKRAEPVEEELDLDELDLG